MPVRTKSTLGALLWRVLDVVAGMLGLLAVLRGVVGLAGKLYMLFAAWVLGGDPGGPSARGTLVSGDFVPVTSVVLAGAVLVALCVASLLRRSQSIIHPFLGALVAVAAFLILRVHDYDGWVGPESAWLLAAAAVVNAIHFLWKGTRAVLLR